MSDNKEYNLKMKAFGEVTGIDITFTAKNKIDLSLAIDLGYDLIESYCDKKRSIILSKYQKEIEEVRRMFDD